MPETEFSRLLDLENHPRGYDDINLLSNVKDLCAANTLNADSQPDLEINATLRDISDKLTKLAVPAAFYSCVMCISPVVSLYFAAKFGTDVYAGFSLESIFVNLTGICVFAGVSSAARTLCSQNFGAGDLKAVALTLQRCYLILSLLAVAIYILWQYAENIFLLIGIDPPVCRVIKLLVSIHSLGLPYEVISNSYKHYLEGIGELLPVLLSEFSFVLLFLSFNTLFIDILNYSYLAIAWAYIISSYGSLAVLLFSSRTETIIQTTQLYFSFELVTGLPEFLSFGIPGCVMVSVEWWTTDILGVIAGQLSMQAVAAHSILLQFIIIAYRVTFGVGTAAATLVGNSIGAKQYSSISKIVTVALIFAVMIDVILGVVICVFRTPLCHLFSSDPDVINIAVPILPYLALCLFVESAQVICGLVLTGMGEQAYVAGINLISCYVIGLPLAYWLCFRAGFGVAGLIYGVYGGTIVQLISYLVVVVRSTQSLLHRSPSCSTTLLLVDRSVMETPNPDCKSGAVLLTSTHP